MTVAQYVSISQLTEKSTDSGSSKRIEPAFRCFERGIKTGLKFTHREFEMKIDTATPKLFVRQASGLVREFGVLDTFIFNVLGFALGLVLAITPTFLGSL